MYFSVEPPRKWKAGHVGTNPPKDFFFNCCICGAKEPEISGILADVNNPTFTGIAVLKQPGTSFLNPAMYCADCFKSECEKAKAQQEVAA